MASPQLVAKVVDDLETVLSHAKAGKPKKVKRSSYTIQTDGKFKLNGKSGLLECINTITFEREKARGVPEGTILDLLQGYAVDWVEALLDLKYDASFSIQDSRQLVLTVRITKSIRGKG